MPLGQNYNPSNFQSQITPKGRAEDSTTFQAGRGTVSDALRQDQKSATATAMQRGFGSNEAALGAQGNRQQSLSDALRQLLVAGGQEQAQQQQFMERSGMNRAMFAFSQDRHREDMEERRKARQNALIGGLVQGGVTAFATPFLGPLAGIAGGAAAKGVNSLLGGGGGETNSPWGALTLT